MPALAWWTERIVTILLVAQFVELTLVRPGTSLTEALVTIPIGLAVLVVTLVVTRRTRAVRERLFPDRRAAAAAGAANGLQERLLAGERIPVDERAVAGRLAWWTLATTIPTCWGFLIGDANMMSLAASRPLDSFQGVAGLVLSVGVTAVLVVELRQCARWRRIAVDATRAEPPTTG